MGEKINNILKGEIISSVFYVLLGLCLILIPTQTVDVICKVVFGLILIGVGIYHIYIYIRGKVSATIMDLLSGVVVFVLGVFLFMTPSIVIKLLPWMLGAFVLVDSLWKFKGAFLLKKALPALPSSHTVRCNFLLQEAPEPASVLPIPAGTAKGM